LDQTTPWAAAGRDEPAQRLESETGRKKNPAGMKVCGPTDIGGSQPRQKPTMLKKIQLLKAVHHAFFENDDNNFRAMGVGFAISAASILLLFGLYQI
jgi:hypothetical protein